MIIKTYEGYISTLLKKAKYLIGSKDYDRNSIPGICRSYHIMEYIINDDKTISVEGNVNFSNYVMRDKLPLKFKRVTGNFMCPTGLLSLEGCPEEVGGNFYCSNNKCSLQYGPKFVGGMYTCSNMGLTSLEGSPEEVGSDFTCKFNNLKTLKYMPKKIEGVINVIRNPLPEEFFNMDDEFIKHVVKWQDDYSIWNKDDTLNKHRYEELLKDLEEEGIKNNFIKPINRFICETKS